MTDLENRVAIVTGTAAPNGIGRAAAKRLAQQGACVVVTDRGGDMVLPDGKKDRGALIAELAEEIQAAGGQAIAVEADLEDTDAMDELVSQAVASFGSPDILVNNAGTTAGSGPFLDSTLADWDLSYRINLRAVVALCQAVLPAMREKKDGSIVNVSSTGGLGADAGFGAYTAMKHGVIGLTKTIAAEYGVDGIRCNAVCPGFIQTDMHAGVNAMVADAEGLSLEEVKRQRYATVAMRKAGLPEDIADAIAYLAGPAAAYVTGTSLVVSGGLPVGL